MISRILGEAELTSTSSDLERPHARSRPESLPVTQTFYWGSRPGLNISLMPML